MPRSIRGLPNTLTGVELFFFFLFPNEAVCTLGQAVNRRHQNNEASHLELIIRKALQSVNGAEVDCELPAKACCLVRTTYTGHMNSQYY